MGFPRQEYWSGLPFPPRGGLSDPGIEPASFLGLLHRRQVLYRLSHQEAQYLPLNARAYIDAVGREAEYSPPMLGGISVSIWDLVWQDVGSHISRQRKMIC